MSSQVNFFAPSLLFRRLALHYLCHMLYVFSQSSRRFQNSLYRIRGQMRKKVVGKEQKGNLVMSKWLAWVWKMPTGVFVDSFLSAAFRGRLVPKWPSLSPCAWPWHGKQWNSSNNLVWWKKTRNWASVDKSCSLLSTLELSMQNFTFILLYIC